MKMMICNWNGHFCIARIEDGNVFRCQRHLWADKIVRIVNIKNGRRCCWIRGGPMFFDASQQGQTYKYSHTLFTSGRTEKWPPPQSLSSFFPPKFCYMFLHQHKRIDEYQITIDVGRKTRAMMNRYIYIQQLKTRGFSISLSNTDGVFMSH